MINKFQRLRFIVLFTLVILYSGCETDYTDYTDYEKQQKVYKEDGSLMHENTFYSNYKSPDLYPRTNPLE